MLVLLVNGEGRTWVMAPVVVDASDGDELSLAVPEEMSGLGRPATVWAGLQRELGTVVLDRLLGEASDAVARWSATALSSVPGNTPATCSRGIGMGTFSAGSVVAVDLAEDMACLADIETLPAPGAAHIDQRTLLRGVDLDVLMDTLSVSQSVALDILTGSQPIDHDQAAVLSDLTGHAVSELLHTPATEPKVAFALEAPWNRPLVEIAAAREGKSPLEIRALVAQQELALAARVAGRRADETTARVRHLLETRLRDAPE